MINCRLVDNVVLEKQRDQTVLTSHLLKIFKEDQSLLYKSLREPTWNFILERVFKEDPKSTAYWKQKYKLVKCSKSYWWGAVPEKS